MLKWLTGGRNEGDANRPVFDQAQVAALDLAVVFKHSTTCPVSFAADREMRAFQAANPAVPVFKVLVREEREASQQIAKWTGVEHESPQVIVFRKGSVVSAASHGDVTEDYLVEATR